MRDIIDLVGTLFVAAFFSASTYAFEWHCISGNAMIGLDVSNSLNSVQEGELYGPLLAEHPVIGQNSVAIRCSRQGSDSATLLRCTTAEADSWPLTAYIFRGSRPEGSHIFARVYFGRDILADLMQC
jgi:hypothetical protein